MIPQAQPIDQRIPLPMVQVPAAAAAAAVADESNFRIAARDFGAKNGFVFKKIVLDTETGVFYEGVQAAADTIGVTKKHLYRKLNGELKNTTKFKYV